MRASTVKRRPLYSCRTAPVAIYVKAPKAPSLSSWTYKVLDFFRSHPEKVLNPTQIGVGLGKSPSSGHVYRALVVLVREGYVQRLPGLGEKRARGYILQKDIA